MSRITLYFTFKAPVLRHLAQCAAVIALLHAGSRRGVAAEIGDFEQDQDGWQLKLGTEFPGAKGSAERSQAAVKAGGHSLKLTGDFAGGGKYVEMSRLLTPVVDLTRVSFWVKSEDVTSIGLRLTDATGQIHQQSCQLSIGSEWKQVIVTKFANGTHWAGANDGVWHGPATAISLLLHGNCLADLRATKGTIWVDTIVTEGNYVLSMPRLESLDVRLYSPKPLLYFWGKNEPPSVTGIEIVSAGSKTVKIPPIRLLNYRGEQIAEVVSGGTLLDAGKSRRWKISLHPPGYGLFYLAMDAGAEKLRIPFAWLAEAAPSWPEGPFGVQTHFAHGPVGRHQVFGGASGALEVIKKMGASWFRDEIGWGQVETEPGTFSVPMDASNPYHYVGPAQEKQLRPLVIIGGVNKAYDDGLPPHTAKGLAGFRRFVDSVVKKWSPTVRAWEVWNEPNLPTGWHGPKPDADQYAAILKTAYECIKTTDPNATVIGVASSGVDLKFIESVLKRDGGKYMDAISVHPYLTVAPEEIDPKIKIPEGMGVSPNGRNFLGELQSLRELLDRSGAGHCKVWITEMGYGAWKDRGYTDWQAAAHDIRQYLLALSVPGVERIFKYNFQDKAVGENAPWDKIMGLVRFDGGPKPAFVAYNTIVRMLFRKRFVATHDTAPENRIFEFSGNGGRTFAAWSVAGARKVSIETKSESLVVTDLMGNERIVTTNGGSVVLDVSEEPIFVSAKGEAEAAVPPKK